MFTLGTYNQRMDFNPYSILKHNAIRGPIEIRYKERFIKYRQHRGIKLLESLRSFGTAPISMPLTWAVYNQTFGRFEKNGKRNQRHASQFKPSSMFQRICWVSDWRDDCKYFLHRKDNWHCLKLCSAKTSVEWTVIAICSTVPGCPYEVRTVEMAGREVLINALKHTSAVNVIILMM